ncbi:MAG TPA: chloride channel protein [Polyangia bacterium]|nr:chloride channel protein [Polyangia bacterium]
MDASPVDVVPRPRLGRIFHDTLSGYLRALPAGLRKFWLLVPLTGVAAGLGAVASVHILQLVQRLAWGRADFLLEAARAASPWRRALVPLGAGVLAVLASFVLRDGGEGHGTSQIIEAIWSRRGRIALRWAIGRGLLSLVIVAMGASLGREGALVYFGAAAGSWLGRRFQLDGDQLKLLVACGASAGIAAAYNTPIGGALFGLEVFLGGLALELYGPIIFASVAATLISRALLFDHPSYEIPHYRLTHPAELAVYLAVGVVLGGVSALFVRTVELTSRLAKAVRPSLRRVLPIFALGLVGVVGIFYPEVYGNGYDTVNLALAGTLPLTLLVILPVLKLVLSSLCASSGAPGGLFTPSLFVGGLAGGALGSIAHHFMPHVVTQTGGYVLVGMAAILAGSTHATLAAALLLFELTGSYEMILPLLAASVVSTVVSRALATESIYTAPLRRRGVELPRMARPAWMQREGVRLLVRDDPVHVRPGAPFDDVVLALARLADGDDLFVVDADGRLSGAIPQATVGETLADQPELELIIAADLMRPAPAVSVDASLWEVTRRALAADSTRLPVVSPREGNRFVGTISTKDVIAAAAARP